MFTILLFKFFLEITAIYGRNYGINRLCPELSWFLTKHTQATDNFVTSALKSSRMDCCPLMSKSVAFGLKCRPFWPICVSLYEVASLFSITSRTLLRLDDSLSRLLLDQLHFVTSTITSGVNTGRLGAAQM